MRTDDARALAGRTDTAASESFRENERAAVRGILIFVAAMFVLVLALLVSVTMLMAIAGNGPPEESLVRIVVQGMPGPYWYY